jgi:hypothetical protein
MLGKSPRNRSLQPIASRLAARLPRWDAEEGKEEGRWGRTDPLHWYYGGLAAFQHGGRTWTRWEAALREVLLPTQSRLGPEVGSWEPRGATGAHGGRLITTALAALCLEVYYRYPRAVDFR